MNRIAPARPIPVLVEGSWKSVFNLPDQNFFCGIHRFHAVMSNKRRLLASSQGPGVLFDSKQFAFVVAMAAACCWPVRLTPSVVETKLGPAGSSASFVSAHRNGFERDGISEDGLGSPLLEDEESFDDEEDEASTWQGTLTGVLRDLYRASVAGQGAFPACFRSGANPGTRPLFLRICLFLC
jgi:hypothetical protein